MQQPRSPPPSRAAVPVAKSASAVGAGGVDVAGAAASCAAASGSPQSSPECPRTYCADRTRTPDATRPSCTQATAPPACSRHRRT